MGGEALIKAPRAPPRPAVPESGVVRKVRQRRAAGEEGGGGGGKKKKKRASRLAVGGE